MAIFISTVRLTEKGPILQIPPGLCDVVDTSVSGPVDCARIAQWLEDHLDYPVVYVAAHSDAQFLTDANQVVPFGYSLEPIDNSIRDAKSLLEITASQFAVQKHDGGALASLSSQSAEDERDSLKRRLAQEIESHSQTRRTLKQTSERLSLAERILHDVNNRLLIIHFSNNQLLAQIPADDPNRLAVIAIHDARMEAAECTRQLQLSSDSIPENFEREADQKTILDLNQLIANKRQLLDQLIPDGVIVSLNLSPSPAMINVNPDTISRIVLNLFLNALSSVAKGGWVSIETRLDTASPTKSTLATWANVILSVSDTGCSTGTKNSSIDESKYIADQKKRVLSFVENIVLRCGGTMECRSSIDRGTKIQVQFRAAQNPPAPLVQPRDPSRTAIRSETILLVEDQDLIRRFIKSSLESAGYTVIEAPDGQSALTRSLENTAPIHLLLTDLSLPGISGRDVARKMRINNPSLPVIFMSGDSNEEVTIDGVLDARTAFLKKPFQPIELLAKLGELLDMQFTSS